MQENRYRRLSEKEHKMLFMEKGNIKSEEEFEKFIREFCDRKYMSDFSKEMSRSASRYLDNFRRQESS